MLYSPFPLYTLASIFLNKLLATLFLLIMCQPLREVDLF